jgi:tRNA(fMet)-specific endonuclease VapC
MGMLIDSSILIAGERGQLDLEAAFNTYPDEDFALSAITASELLHGVHRAKSVAQRNRREAFVEGLLSRFPVFAFDLVTARLHARLSAELAAQGISIGLHDFIIATTAMAKGYRVATRDERSFPRIPGLSLLRW